MILLKLVLSGVFVGLPILVYAAPQKKIAQEATALVNSRIYTEPNRYGKPISIVAKGLKLRVLRYSSSKSWALVETPSQRRGWIPVQSTSLNGRYSAKLLSNSGKSPSRRTSNKPVPPNNRLPASDLSELGYDSENDSSQEISDENTLDLSNQDLSQEPLLLGDGVVPDDGYESRPTQDDQSELSTTQSEGLQGDQSPQGIYEETSDVLGDGNDSGESLNSQLLAIDNPLQKNSNNLKQSYVDPGKIEEKQISSYKIGLSLEYSNQVSVGAASGFGIGTEFLFVTSSSFSWGLGAFWDSYTDKAENSVELVTRKAKVLRLGPVIQLSNKVLGIDGMLGLVRTSTNVSVTEDGEAVESEFNGNSAETSFGLRLSPFVLFDLGKNQAKAYLSYSIDFYGKDPSVGDSGLPQAIALGASFYFGI